MRTQTREPATTSLGTKALTSNYQKESRVLSIKGGHSKIRNFLQTGLIFLLLVYMAHSSYGQWKTVDKGNYVFDIVPNGDWELAGNVGIGTYYPAHKLTIDADRPRLAFTSSHKTGIGGIIEFNEIDNQMRFQRWDDIGQTWASTTMTIDLDGESVGIGTTSPSSVLHVKGVNDVPGIKIELPGGGDDSTTDFLSFINRGGGATQGTAIVWKNGGNSKNAAAIMSQPGYGYDFGSLHFQTAHNDTLRTQMTIDHLGHVGIGTISPGSYTLAVEGKIGARGIDVKSGSWADFVFAEDYALRSLEEVESFIEQNKHLPDVPSEMEILEKGIDVSEMFKLQMQKIEELTLYLIELKKENETLKQTVNALQHSK